MFRYFHILKLVIKTAIIRDTMFRGAFLIQFLAPFLWLALFIIIIQVIFTHTPTLAGWSRSDLLVLLGVWSLIDDLTGATFWHGVGRLPALVADGKLDMLFTRPIDSQFMIATERFSLSRFCMLVPDVLLIAFGLYHSGIASGWGIALTLPPLILASVLLFFSIFFFINTLGFWFFRIENVAFLFEGVENIAKYPLDIFGRTLKFLSLTAIPFGVIFMFPAQALLGTLGVSWAIYAPFLALVFFVLTRKFYQYSVRRYSSVA